LLALPTLTAQLVTAQPQTPAFNATLTQTVPTQLKDSASTTSAKAALLTHNALLDNTVAQLVLVQLAATPMPDAVEPMPSALSQAIPALAASSTLTARPLESAPL
jgi:hypothetical protein